MARTAARFHPRYDGALTRLPSGRQVFHGLPFDLGPAAAGAARWILIDGPTTIDLGGHGPASHVVVAHLCDAWRDDGGLRPDGLALGHVVPVGEPLARYRVLDGRGRTRTRTVRRRFEINDGILGWGSGAFAAIPHLANEVIDWRGPHPAQGPGRYAPAGQSGTLTIMPGSYGTSQTGVSDFVPSATDDALIWLHAIELDDGAEPVELQLEPLAAGRPGSDVIVAGGHAVPGTGNPLARLPRFQVRVEGLGGRPPEVDLGMVIRVQPAPPADEPAATDPIVGWGAPRADPAAAPAMASIVDLTIAPDAELSLDDWTVAGRDLLAGGRRRDPADRLSIELLPAPRVAVEIELRRRGQRRAGPRSGPLPGRRRPLPAAGRPPGRGQPGQLRGHRRRPHPRIRRLCLCAGPVRDRAAGRRGRRRGRRRVRPHAAIAPDLEVDPTTRRARAAAGPGHRPARRAVGHRRHPRPLPRRRRPPCSRPRPRTSTSINLLAAQWGDLYTNVADLPWGSMADRRAARLVVVGTENRQNMLGHLALLGAPSRPTRRSPAAARPRAGWAARSTVLLADWADRCRAAGGLVVAAHFPLPYAEIAADIVRGQDRRASRPRPWRPASTTRRSSSGIASSTSAIGCRSWPGPTRCRPRSRSAPSGPTPTS